MIADREVVGEELETVGGYKRLTCAYAVYIVVDHADGGILACVVDNLHLFDDERLALDDINGVVVHHAS